MFRVLLFLVAAAFAAAAPTSFRDSDGATHQPLGKAPEHKATVLLFLMPDCPVANAMAPELSRIASEYGKRGVRFYAVYATSDAAEVAAHRRDYRLPFPGLLDPKCVLARGAGATRVPEAAVYSAEQKLLYRGRIDDRAVKVGRIRPEPGRHDLRAALDAILAGRKPDPATTEAVGCYLPL
jgi:thiol-disulfide isomerase/thioredoxin